MKVRFVVNPVAGGGERVEEITGAVREVLADKRGIFEIKVSSSRHDTYRLAEEARDRGYEAVFACGGDGTVNQVASAVVNSRTVLGVIPVGSGNGLARSLDIPMNIKWAVSVLVKGRTRYIDVGTVCGRYFFSTAGVGFDAAVCKGYASWTRLLRRRGILPYVPVVLKEFFTRRPDSVTVAWDNESIHGRPLILTVANTREYGAGAVIAPDAEPDDGLLDVSMVESPGLLGAIDVARRLFAGSIAGSRYFRSVQAPVVDVIREVPGLIHVDGETFAASTRIRFGILPNALRVWAF